MRTLLLDKILPLFLMVFIMSSCKSLRNVASADNTTPRDASRKKDEVKFLDGIVVSPGRTSASIDNKTSERQSKNKVSYTSDVSLSGPATIESVQWLQLKYAIIFDAAVEKLTNTTLLKNIDDWWGTKYCLGGTSESCIDCSAFTQTIMREVYGIDIPRTAAEQYNNCDLIDSDDLKEGDLVFFHTRGRGKSITHVGLYVTNNKFVHAATSGGVMVSDLNDTYWHSKYVAGGRVRRVDLNASAGNLGTK